MPRSILSICRFEGQRRSPLLSNSIQFYNERVSRILDDEESRRRSAISMEGGREGGRERRGSADGKWGEHRVGWKFTIKIPAVALPRVKMGREGAGGWRGWGWPHVFETLVAFKPRSAFKLASAPIHAPLYTVAVFSYGASLTILLSFQPFPVRLPS